MENNVYIRKDTEDHNNPVENPTLRLSMNQNGPMSLRTKQQDSEKSNTKCNEDTPTVDLHVQSITNATTDSTSTTTNTTLYKHECTATEKYTTKGTHSHSFHKTYH